MEPGLWGSIWISTSVSHVNILTVSIYGNEAQGLPNNTASNVAFLMDLLIQSFKLRVKELWFSDTLSYEEP